MSSATSDPKTDAFNFLTAGAGTQVFEVILKVRSFVLFCFVSYSRPYIVIHRSTIRGRRLFSR